ncbi:oleate hydratase [Paraglaciecola sp. MB-3u-78]|uniref:oleate hydratase n=1 Tax=Paraglaciecola sp. MB-3u-78 TaxID=2058332 RepID=UPI001E3EA929|nr:oleate hydratase [Paraglaciecola sp. MB-3u-78]
MKTDNKQNYKDSKVYLIGSGIAGLASAVYLEKDVGVPGENIHILEKDLIAGGATDGAGDKDKGFVVRGGRMHEMHYECYWELLSHIPSLEDSNISVRDESYEFNQRFVSNAQARLLKEGKKLDVSSYGLSFKQQADFIKLTYVSESSLADKRM